VIAHLGLGSNLGDRLGHLVAGLTALGELGAGLEVSPVYETEPVGGPAGQAPYLNLVARLVTELPPRRMLAEAMRIEQQAERVRTVRFGPRTLDVDLLLLGEAAIGDLVIDEPDLVVPHPRLAERAFVLAPLEALDPGAVPQGWRERLGGEEAVGRMVRPVLRLERTPAGAWLAREVSPASPVTPASPVGTRNGGA
jgi:2-amino-4-hydroxy-6-hydroxymethyldihydropteridine diphosphokinase